MFNIFKKGERGQDARKLYRKAIRFLLIGLFCLIVGALLAIPQIPVLVVISAILLIAGAICIGLAIYAACKSFRESADAEDPQEVAPLVAQQPAGDAAQADLSAAHTAAHNLGQSSQIAHGGTGARLGSASHGLVPQSAVPQTLPDSARRINAQLQTAAFGPIAAAIGDLAESIENRGRRAGLATEDVGLLIGALRGLNYQGDRNAFLSDTLRLCSGINRLLGSATFPSASSSDEGSAEQAASAHSVESIWARNLIATAVQDVMTQISFLTMQMQQPSMPLSIPEPSSPPPQTSSPLPPPVSPTIPQQATAASTRRHEQTAPHSQQPPRPQQPQVTSDEPRFGGAFGRDQSYRVSQALMAHHNASRRAMTGTTAPVVTAEADRQPEPMDSAASSVGEGGNGDAPETAARVDDASTITLDLFGTLT